MKQNFSSFLASLPLLFKHSYAQGVTVNVCGRNYQDAENNCGVNPSCANLKCPNNYWEEGHVLMSCFAVPMDRCNFSGPEAMAAPVVHVPTEFDPKNTNYCGPIDGGWQLAVDNCSALTACPGGSPEECQRGWTCYGGVVCDPSSKANTDTMVDAGTDVYYDAPTAIEATSTTTPANVAASHEVQEDFSEDIEDAGDEDGMTNVIPTDTSNDIETLDTSVHMNYIQETTSTTTFTTTTTTTQAPELTTTEPTPPEANESFELSHPTIVQAKIPTGDTVVTSSHHIKSYCGPVGAQGRKRAITMCSSSTMCGIDGSCPDGMVCYKDILCDGFQNVDQNPYSTTNESQSVSSTSPSEVEPTTSSSETTLMSSQTVDTVEILVNRHYCGPDPSIDHNAWTTAFSNCSPETACAYNQPCPDGQICFGGIDCLSKQVEVEETIGPTVNSEATSTESAVGLAVELPGATTTTSTTETTSTTATSTTTTSTSDVAAELLQSPTDLNMYCGPDPKHNSDAWMTALANCSPQTACGRGYPPCRQGQFCYALLDVNCSEKDSFFKALSDENVASSNDAQESTTITSSSTSTTTSPITTKPVITEQGEPHLEDNTFFCGSEGERGWLEASELCIPCHNGDPSTCGVGLTCYAGVTCTKPKKSPGEKLLEAERVHVGYCGVHFYDAQDKCADRRPCSLDEDCDDWHPTCYAVRCDDKLNGVQPVAASSTDGSTSEGPSITIVNSFCGAWYEETKNQCTTRPPCKSSNDCSGYEGCFADISCTFDEQSSEFIDFLANLEALDNLNSANSTVEHSNLRPGPADTTYYSAQNSAEGTHNLHGVATILFAAIVLII